MTDEATGQLLGRFVSAVQPVVPLVSVWAHGSLAAGDYQPGRSDLDLIAIVDRPCTAAEQQHLGEVHESLGNAIALASKLHCSYCAAGELDDPERLHLTWAHEEFMRRRVTPVTRRELHDFGLVLYGEERPLEPPSGALAGPRRGSEEYRQGRAAAKSAYLLGGQSANGASRSACLRSNSPPEPE